MNLQRCIKAQVPASLNDFNGILLVGEAPGAEEEKFGKPFVGPAGAVLNILLDTAGIDHTRCAITNVFHIRPENNKVSTFFTANKKQGCFPNYPMGYAYLRTELAPEINRLSSEIKYLLSYLKVVVALGGVALWALTGRTGITKQRGLVGTVTVEDVTRPLVPTFHPSYLLHKNNPAENQLVVQDLQLALSLAEIEK